MDKDNINDIIERDWNDAEMDAVALAGGGFVETALPSLPAPLP